MSYISQYFGKGPDEISYQDVIDFFAIEREESDKIEFKSFTFPGENNQREKENGIIRSICAFLNSSGGLIIWGAPIGNIPPGRNEKVFTGDLSPVSSLIEKDYFINRITDSITPAPNSIYFKRIENGNGNNIYLIDISQSEYSPHQFRSIYYMRIDGQTKPAPHHYIEALFKKITYPKLKGYIMVEDFYHQGPFITFNLVSIIFNLSKLQNEHKANYRIIVGRGAVYSRHIAMGPNDTYFMDGHELRISVNDTIYYNSPYRRSESVRLTTHQMDNGCELEIWFYFGGENSPLLLSKYKLRINLNNLQADANTFFVELDENRYSFDHSDALGKTEEQRISEIIGR